MAEEFEAQTQNQVNNIRTREKVNKQLEVISTDITPVVQDIKNVVKTNLEDQTNLNDIYQSIQDSNVSMEQLTVVQQKQKEQDEKLNKIIALLEKL